jgi:hypothetical protein
MVPHARALLTHGIILLPFTINHLSSTGHFGWSLFFDSNSSVPPVAPKLQWTLASFPSQHAFAYKLFKQLNHLPTSLLAWANKTWCIASTDSRYGTSYHTHYPSQWATQALALNLSKTLIKHIQHNSSTCISHYLLQCSNNKTAINQNLPAFQPLPVCFYSPGSTFHDQSVFDPHFEVHKTMGLGP